MSEYVPVLSYRAEVKRKALHLAALAIPLGILLFGTTIGALVLIPLGLLALAGDVLRVRVEWVRGLIEYVFGPIMRPTEKPPLGAQPVLNGATSMCLTAAICVLLFSAEIAAAALLIQMIGDAAAALVGRRWGRTRLGGTQKSLEGSAAFFVSGFLAGLVAVFWPGSALTILALSAGAIASTVTEALPLPLNDNMRVPLVGGAVMLVVQSL